MKSAPGAGGGQRAIVAALAAFAVRPGGSSPWMGAADLAREVGADGEHDPAFEADVQALYARGDIRLMAGGVASGSTFYKAMLIPPAAGATGTDLEP
jgi:hypothetical protein